MQWPRGEHLGAILFVFNILTLKPFILNILALKYPDKPKGMNILRETRGRGWTSQPAVPTVLVPFVTRLITTAVRSSICLVPFAKAFTAL
ncbi:hypothetical protein BDD14_3083 [Edaphobacter modestus]|uniref:Uncharacterized protein n=1 Tax=Edaphobacter modestus TaxID=388466 RepID=A0A4Q7YV83_9BACT|nr:hypothetical protein BDD14_3083 [Edaphobacter modestus]